jgi:hypothetical protein
MIVDEHQKVDIFCFALWRGYFVSRLFATVLNVTVDLR